MAALAEDPAVEPKSGDDADEAVWMDVQQLAGLECKCSGLAVSEGKGQYEEGGGEVWAHGRGRQAGDEAVWMDAQQLAGWECKCRRMTGPEAKGL